MIKRRHIHSDFPISPLSLKRNIEVGFTCGVPCNVFVSNGFIKLNPSFMELVVSVIKPVVLNKVIPVDHTGHVGFHNFTITPQHVVIYTEGVGNSLSGTCKKDRKRKGNKD